MRKTKTISLEGKEITVRELTVHEILDIMNDTGMGDQTASTKADGWGDLKTLVEKHLIKTTDVKLEDFMDLAPSEIKEVVDGFREVNAVFFEAAQRLGLGGLVEQIVSALQKDFSAIAAGSFKLDM